MLMLVCCGSLSTAICADLPVTHTKVVGTPNISRPGYLKSYSDPVFGTRVTRITGDPGTTIPNLAGGPVWDKVARHIYSKNAAWNCDQSLLLLGRHFGFPSMLFLEGTNYKPVFGRNTSPGSELRWHPTQPNLMVYVTDNSVGFWDVRGDSTEIVAKFPGYSELNIGPWEGNLSIDGRLMVLGGKKAGDHIAFAYDLVEKRKHADLVFQHIDVDWVSVSPTGKYIILNGRISGAAGDQTQIYDLNGRKIGEPWTEYGRPSHFDLAVDSRGEDVAVGVSKSKPDDGRVIKRRLRDGKITVLTPGGYANHVSTRNVKRPGWAYVSYLHRGPTWPPYWGEVVAVKLDGSLTVERIAHLRTSGTDYLTEAHAVPSPDGRRVLWASDWNEGLPNPVGGYVAEGPEQNAK